MLVSSYPVNGEDKYRTFISSPTGILSVYVKVSFIASLVSLFTCCSSTVLPRGSHSLCDTLHMFTPFNFNSLALVKSNDTSSSSLSVSLHTLSLSLAVDGARDAAHMMCTRERERETQNNLIKQSIIINRSFACTHSSFSAFLSITREK